MNNILLLCIIILVCFLIIIGLCIRHNYAMELYRNQIKINEGGRIKAMNGLENEKAIPFSHHYNSFMMFKKLIQYLDENDIEYFVSSGLLIGLFRHNNSFIPWDDDIDICIFEKDLNKLDNTFDKNAWVIKYNGGSNYKDDDHVFIDVFVMGDDLNYIDKRHRDTWPNDYFISNNELFPLRKKEFKIYLPDGKVFETILVNIPNKSEQYLKRVYPNYDKIFISYGTHAKFYNLAYNDFVHIL